MIGETRATSAWQRDHTLVLLCFFSTFNGCIDRVKIAVKTVSLQTKFMQSIGLLGPAKALGALATVRQAGTAAMIPGIVGVALTGRQVLD